MYVKKLQLEELELVDPNADYSGTQTIFIDFDGANEVSYDNDALNIHIDKLSVAASGLSQEEQFQIVTDLNNTFMGTGVNFTVDVAGLEPDTYSTIYVDDDDTAFSEYGYFQGLAENIDAGNQNRNDAAFVFVNNINSIADITETIVHESGHLLGFQHKDADDDTLSISSYALSAGEEFSLKIVNNFKSNTDYFSVNYSDEEVWLYSLNTGGSLSYTDTEGHLQIVTDASAFQLSTVQGGILTISNGPGSSKLFAGLGNSTTSPFSGTNGPGIFDSDIPYTFIEWTVQEGANDNVDVSYIDTFAFPTTLRVRDGSGTMVNKATFKNNTTAETLIDALRSVISNQPVGPGGANYPVEGNVGWGPLISTVASDPTAQRWIGSSKYWQSGEVAGAQESIYLYAPSFNDYLGYLKTNETVLFPDDNNISGWYLDYSGNLGYSFYLSVTGDNDNYGLQIHDIRHNTVGPADAPTPPWIADPSAWTAFTGSITVAANNANIAYDGYEINGNWTDITLYSGASLLNGDFASGPIVTGTGDFAPGGSQVALNSTILASLSASIATGLLGNSFYMDKIQSAQSGSTMYWFNELQRDEFKTKLFSAAWSESQEFYDPFWEIMADYTNMQGYLSPFNDRWANFQPGFDLGTSYSIEWEIGTLSLINSVFSSGDFNNDGKDDILWRGQVAGAVGMWVDGIQANWNETGSANIDDWTIVGIGDFNNDGKDDILWRGQVAGTVGMWGDGIQTNWSELGSANIDEWKIVAVGNFVNDGNNDIVWRGQVDGTVGMWVDGMQANWNELGSVSIDDWTIVGVGDFNNDGKDDILWRSQTNGAVGMWGDGMQANWNETGTASLDDWKIVGIGDFSNDGKDDILWRGQVNGVVGIWADGLQANWSELGSLSIDDWKVASVGDFFNNGKDDIVWRGQADGTVGMWVDGIQANWNETGSANINDWKISSGG